MKTKSHVDPRIGIVGGQAVLEGVMMKSGEKCSLAVRTPDGKIAVYNSTFTSLRKKHKFFDLPLIRGIVSFIEQLKLSMDMLTKSAEMQGIDTEQPETKFEKWLCDKFGNKLMSVVTGVGMVLGLAIGVVMFLMLPTFAAKGLDFLSGGFIGASHFLRALVEGLIRIGVFVGYIALTSLMPDMRRTYEYHGAEHKSVACFEKGLPLTPENAAACTRFHPRCGTSFMFVMIILGIIIGLFITWDNRLVRVLCKILTLPLVVGIGYEFLMFSAKHDNIVTKVLTAPGLWIQRITTREPDASQIEVAIRSLKCALPDEFPEETAIVEAENAAEKTDVSEKSDGTSSENPAAESTGENGNTHSSEEETTVETDGHDSAAS